MKTSQPPSYCIALLHTTSFSKALTWFLLMPFKPLSSPHIYHRYGDEIFFPCLFTYWFLLVCRTAAVFLSQSFSRLRIPVPSSSHFCGSLGIQAAVLQTFYSWCREDTFLDSEHPTWSETLLALEEILHFPCRLYVFLNIPSCFCSVPVPENMALLTLVQRSDLSS